MEILFFVLALIAWVSIYIVLPIMVIILLHKFIKRLNKK